MPLVDVTVETALSNSMRARQVCSMFDAPPEKKCTLNWKIDVPIDANDWRIGLIVGPSGSGKSTVMRHLFGDPKPLAWGAESVVDDFDPNVSVEDVSRVCQAVGFNSVPSWLRPYHVLSNGEKFRVDLARRMLETEGTIVVDEFTSVVDRQVAKIGSHAVQKYIRKRDRQFVAVSCHFDLEEWLQPDWVLNMATRQFQRRLLQRRPSIECTIGRLPRSAWAMFAPYHYMSANLHRGAKCFGLWADGRLATFAGVLPVAVSRGKGAGEAVWRVSRVVTLPDFQGMGLAMVLVDALGADYRARGYRFRNYPAHPGFIRTHDRSKNWKLAKRPGTFSTKQKGGGASAMGGRPCAVFEYIGPPAARPSLGL